MPKSELVVELESIKDLRGDDGMIIRNPDGTPKTTSEWWTLYGPEAGDRGVFLGQNPDGIYDEPVDSIWNSHAWQTGASFGGIRVNKRDVILGMEIVGNCDLSWKEADSAWRKAWSYKRDCRLWVTTEDSRRYLELRLSEAPKFAPYTDPFKDAYGHVIMTCVAGYPRWREEDYIAEWTFTNGEPVGHIPAWNPCDVEVWPKWVVQANPKEAGVLWTLPDWAFDDDHMHPVIRDQIIGQQKALGLAEQDPYKRMVPLVTMEAGENLVVDTDPEAEQVTSDREDTEPWLRMGGRSFLFPLPPYTGSPTKPINYEVRISGRSGLVGPLTCQLRIPRTWSRPWGLE